MTSQEIQVVVDVSWSKGLLVDESNALLRWYGGTRKSSEFYLLPLNVRAAVNEVERRRRLGFHRSG